MSKIFIISTYYTKRFAMYAGLLGMLCGGATACSDDPEGSCPAEVNGGEINLGVKSVGDLQESRALIAPEGTKTALDKMRETCTGVFANNQQELSAPDQQCIRLWGSYITTAPKDPTNIFINDPLIYNQGKVGQTDNFYNTGWNYPLDDQGNRKTWQPGATYVFRAIFPGNINAKEEKMPIECLSAATMNIRYSTSVLQEDVLVACGEKKNPVPLDFKHILAAVQFKFRYKHEAENVLDGHPDGLSDGAEDYITSCWLENTGTDLMLSQKVGCFATVGTLTYGQGEVGANNEDRNLMFWLSNLCERKMYVWESTSGLRFWNADGKSHACTAYTEASTEGQLFINNGGWVLIIPQFVHRNVVELCFTTKLNEQYVYRVPLNRLIPDGTTEPLPKHMIEYKGRKYAPLEYKHSKRYTYTVIFRKTDIDVEVDIQPWNEIDISDEIIF